MTRPEYHSFRMTFQRSLTVIGAVLLLGLLVILLMGLVPVSANAMAPAPQPAGSYDEAVTRFRLLQQDEAGIIDMASQSYLLSHGAPTARVYVLVHGITNSPLQWLELGQTLYAQGHNVLILRMPYHGLKSHQVSELKRLTHQDLRVYADQAVDLAAGLGDEVVVVGISGGGAVAAWMIQNRPEVQRALLLAPFFGIYDVPDSLNTVLMNAFSRLPNISLQDPAEPRREWAYRGEATRGVAAFLGLGSAVRRAAQAGLAPGGQIIILTTARDTVANNQSTAQLVNLWQQAGGDVSTVELAPALDIPHNSVDPAADPAKKRLVYDKILDLLGEQP